MINVESVGKTFSPLLRPSITALADLSLSVPSGEVLGIAGPNGSGKSTLISLLVGFLHPTRGTIRIEGLSPRQYVEQFGVGYLPEFLNIPQRWTVQTTLLRLASLRDLPRSKVRADLDGVVALSGLDSQTRKRVGELSKGNLQRLGIAQSVIGRSALVIFDEPTYGLDPIWTFRFREVVQSLRSNGTTVILASHDLLELQRICDQVVILREGRLATIVNCSVSSAQLVDWIVSLDGVSDISHFFTRAVPVVGRVDSWRVTATKSELTVSLERAFAAGAVLNGCHALLSPVEAAYFDSISP